MIRTPIDLGPYCNARGATADDERAAGRLNAWGNSFPAEELPFGALLEVGGQPFLLQRPVPGGGDHLEALGQVIDAGGAGACTGLAFLCCGEMGEQDLEIVACGAGTAISFRITAGPWLREAGSLVPRHAHACSHLHYPGGYELDGLRPVLWACEHRWPEPLGLERLELGWNPLFHLFALTALGKEGLPD